MSERTASFTEAAIEADPDVPMIRITRDFAATPDQLYRAHIDADIFARWIGPQDMAVRIIEWDARDGGAWHWVSTRDGQDHGFRGCFHQVSPHQVVQTFTYLGMPDDVALETARFEDLGNGRTRLHTQSLVDSFEGRDAWLASGMETGVNDGYAKLDALLASGGVAASIPGAVALVDLDPVERHRAVAGRFGEIVNAVPDWDAPTPVEGWVARDVVRHLVEWFPAFLAAGGIELPAGPAVDDGPEAAWKAHAAAVQAVIDDEVTAAREFSHPQAGTHRLADAVDRFYTADVFMHTWDLARAAGIEPALDPAWCEQMATGMEPIDEMLRASGHYGPRHQVADNADPQTRLIGFIGRDPAWRAR